MLTPDQIHADACASQGYAPETTEAKYARCGVESALAHWHELPEIPCCYSPEMTKAERKAAKKAYDAAVAKRQSALNHIAVREQAAKCGFDPNQAVAALDRKETAGLIVGFLILIIGGPLYLFLTVVCAVGSWIIEEELQDHYGPKGVAMCAAQFRESK